MLVLTLTEDTYWTKSIVSLPNTTLHVLRVAIDDSLLDVVRQDGFDRGTF